MSKSISRLTLPTILVLVAMVSNLPQSARADEVLAKELRDKGMECRGGRDAKCFEACWMPGQRLFKGVEVEDTDIDACRAAYDAFKKNQPPAPPTYEPNYAPMPDVIGILRAGQTVVAADRQDWKRHCRSSALIGDAGARQQWDIPVGATVRVSGIRYVTNPKRTKNPVVNACRAAKVEVVSAP